MLTRILTALPLIAGFLAALFLAAPLVWMGIMGLALFLGAMEWAGLARLGRGPAAVYGVLLTLAGLGLAHLAGYSHWAYWVYWTALVFWLVVPVLLRLGYAFRNPLLLLGVGALVLLPTYLAIVLLHGQSRSLLLATVGLVAIADSAAYFSGRRFGRRKLAPSISPGKTWEGVVGAWVAVSAYALLLSIAWPAEFPTTWVAALGAAWALLFLSVVGDLLESWVKRQAGVKDSGTLLPGHGGVLDRIDSLTATLPAAALFHSWMS